MEKREKKLLTRFAFSQKFETTNSGGIAGIHQPIVVVLLDFFFIE